MLSPVFTPSYDLSEFVSPAERAAEIRQAVDCLTNPAESAELMTRALQGYSALDWDDTTDLTAALLHPETRDMILSAILAGQSPESLAAQDYGSFVMRSHSGVILAGCWTGTVEWVAMQRAELALLSLLERVPVEMRAPIYTALAWLAWHLANIDKADELLELAEGGGDTSKLARLMRAQLNSHFTPLPVLHRAEGRVPVAVGEATASLQRKAHGGN